ncbi:hypothetical protein DFH09DRAFT_1276332, partial [Mycena vulgaris]
MSVSFYLLILSPVLTKPPTILRVEMPDDQLPRRALTTISVPVMTSESTSLSSGWSSDDSASSPALNGAVAFFPQAQHFVVSGGHFTTNHVTTEPRDLHRDFRKIPLG